MDKIKFSLVAVIVVAFLGCQSIIVKATTAARPQQSEIGFSVTAKLPQNQLDKRRSFFDLAMKPGQTENLQVVITNATNRKIEVETAIHTAHTNGSGQIEYVIPPKTTDPSLKYRMSTITTLKDKAVLTIPANSNRTVTAQAQIPTGPFNGLILGGWFFKRVDQKVTGTVTDATNITNQYAYVLGMRYTIGKLPAPQLKLGHVTAGLSNYHRGIFPELRNVSATIVSNVALHTTITAANQQVIKDSRQKGVEFAPNSVYRLPMLTGKTPLTAGKYHLKMDANNGNQHWHFERDFTITAAAAKKYNEQTVDHSAPNPIWWLIWGVLGTLFVVLMVGGGYWGYRKYRQTRQ